MKAPTLILLLLAVAGWGLVAFGAVRYAETAERAAYFEAAGVELAAANVRQDSVYAERRHRDSLAIAYHRERAKVAEAARARYQRDSLTSARDRASAEAALVSAETTPDSLAAALDALTACDDGRAACEDLRAAVQAEATACSAAAEALTASVDECERSLVLRDTLIATQAAELELWRSLPPTAPGPVRPLWETATIGAAGVGIGALLTLILVR